MDLFLTVFNKSVFYGALTSKLYAATQKNYFCIAIGSCNCVMPALKRTRLTALAWRKANWCINCVLMRVMERRERDNG